MQTRLNILQAEQQLRAGQRDFRKGRYDHIVAFIRLKTTAGSLTLGDIADIDERLVPQHDAADPDPRTLSKR